MTGVVPRRGGNPVPPLRLRVRGVQARAGSGLAVFVLIALLAIFAPWIAPQNPYDLAQLDIMDGRLPPGSKSVAGYTYLLGTDDQGRDMFSGMLYGLRISLGVGVGSALFAAVVGTTLGLLAAFFGRPRRRRRSCGWSTCSCRSRRSWSR